MLYNKSYHNYNINVKKIGKIGRIKVNSKKHTSWNSCIGSSLVIILILYAIFCASFYFQYAKDLDTAPTPKDVPYCNVNGSYMHEFNDNKDDELLQITVFIRHGIRTHFDGKNRKCAKNAYFSPTTKETWKRGNRVKDKSPCLRKKAIGQIQNIASKIFMFLAADQSFFDKFLHTPNRTQFFTTNTSRTRDTVDIFAEKIVKSDIQYPIFFFPDVDDPLRPFETTCNFGQFLSWENEKYGKLEHERLDFSRHKRHDSKLVFDFLKVVGKTGNSLDGWLRKYQKSVSQFCNGDKHFNNEKAIAINNLYPLFSTTMSTIYKAYPAFDLSKQVMHSAVSILTSQVEDAVKGGDDYWLMSVFCTHDYSIAFILSSLGFENWSWPIFADTVTVRTFRRKSNGEIYVQVDQNGLKVGALDLDDFRRRTAFVNRFKGQQCPF